MSNFSPLADSDSFAPLLLQRYNAVNNVVLVYKKLSTQGASVVELLLQFVAVFADDSKAAVGVFFAPFDAIQLDGAGAELLKIKRESMSSTFSVFSGSEAGCLTMVRARNDCRFALLVSFYF